MTGFAGLLEALFDRNLCCIYPLKSEHDTLLGNITSDSLAWFRSGDAHQAAVHQLPYRAHQNPTTKHAGTFFKVCSTGWLKTNWSVKMKHCWKSVCWQQHWPATLRLPSMRVLCATLLTGPLFSPLTAPSWERKWPDRTDRMGAISGNAYWDTHSARPRCPWCCLSGSRIVGSLFSKVRRPIYFSKWTNKTASLVPGNYVVSTLMRISPTGGHMITTFTFPPYLLCFGLYFAGLVPPCEPSSNTGCHCRLARFHFKRFQLYRWRLNVGPHKWREESRQGCRCHCILCVTSKRFVLCGDLVALCV